jgi:hypothetical protein
MCNGGKPTDKLMAENRKGETWFVNCIYIDFSCFGVRLCASQFC